MHGRPRHVDQGDLSGRRSALTLTSETKSRLGRSQSARSSEEVPETGWSEGA